MVLVEAIAILSYVAQHAHCSNETPNCKPAKGNKDMRSNEQEREKERRIQKISPFQHQNSEAMSRPTIFAAINAYAGSCGQCIAKIKKRLIEQN